MTDISKLRELLERVESATGGDCKLEDDIAISLLGWRYHNFTDDHGEWRDEHDKYAMCPDAYTSSIDAAVALCERVLPGWKWSLQNSGVLSDSNGYAMVATDAEAETTIAEAATPALALCDASLRAKIAMLEKEPV